MRDCSGADGVKRRVIDDMFVRRKFDGLALSEPNSIKKRECVFV